MKNADILSWLFVITKATRVFCLVMDVGMVMVLLLIIPECGSNTLRPCDVPSLDFCLRFFFFFSVIGFYIIYYPRIASAPYALRPSLLKYYSAYKEQTIVSVKNKSQQHKNRTLLSQEQISTTQ